MKTENRVPSIQDSALRTRHSALRWGEAMKQILSILLVIAVMVVAAMAQAQQPTKIPRIGYLTAASPSAYRDPHRGIPAGSARAWVRGGEKHCH